uniref:Protocadherin beta-1 n=1 Tax=Seriola dumerili TaxID=41447 RepID=A0A3B4UZP7_SERDU
MSPYSFYITENNPPGAPVFSVRASDRDEGDNARISYHILRNADHENKVISFLNINSDNGDVLALKSFDFETLKTFHFHVVASDSGTPSLSSNVTVNVFILDQNDNAPVILYPVSSNGSAEARFQLQAARDADSGSLSVQQYKLSHNEHFRLEVKDRGEDRKTPSLVLQKTLDRETVKTHVLLLTATDGGKPPRSGNMTITVDVSDVNDNPPVFTQDSYHVDLKENSPFGTTVIYVNATDMDEGSNGEIVYSFGNDVDTRVHKRFDLNPVTGVITVAGAIDFEESGRYEIDIQASDKGAATLTTDKTVIINIVDVNDNAPEIEVTSFSRALPEDSKPGTTVALISVKDSDSGLNGKVMCHIGQGLPFLLTPSLQNNMYSLVTKSLLDREQQSQYNVTIVAKDAGEPSLSSDKTIKIVVSDVNDNNPEFSQNPYTFYITENNKPGAFAASDVKSSAKADEDNNVTFYLMITLGSVSALFLISIIVGYRIVTGSTEPLFHVNQNDGILYVKRRIDREEVCERTSPCLIQLKTVLENPLEIHYVTVEILDMNDHSPVFPEKEKRLEISESALAGARFQLQAARDSDVGQFSIQQYKLSHNDYFRVEVKDRGEDRKVPFLVLQKQLDRETTGKHKLRLTAVDGGKPAKSGNIEIIVDILDVNDNSPVFNKEQYSATLKENVPVGTVVIQVNATDLDQGANGEIIYSFGNEVDSKLMDLFSIDQNTGEIQVTGPIDFEKSRIYEIDIQASDKGAAPLTTDKSVLITVIDVNDNAPEIEVTSFSSSIKEDSKIGTTVALISVSDLDSGINGKVICTINEDVPFTLSPSLQENMYAVVTRSELDREIISQYDVTIVAKDAGDPLFISEKTIKVVISDVNDNSPEFSSSPYTFYITENNKPGASVFSVKASDRDESDNALISYHILRDGRGNKLSSFLNINSENGDILALKSFDFETLKTFHFHVVASDSGTPSLSSNVTVNVFILDQNDNAPVILYPVSSNGSAEGVEEIPRNVNAGHLVTKVRAYDADIGYNGWLLFSLQEVTDHSLFGLDRYTGQIRTLRSFTETDEAEHKPVILVKDNVTSFSSSIPEDSRPGTTVALISVNDLDSGLNGKVICSIGADVPFALSPSLQDKMYSLVTKSPLDREKQSQYDLTITAKDAGHPPLSSEKTIRVVVSDVNDNSPEFSLSPYTFYVTEANEPGATLFSVKAYDGDENDNAHISYHILRDGSEDNKLTSFLNINSENGYIMALKSFDFETLKTFQFKVVASDSGTPSLSSNVTVNVFILDQNDNAPVILYPVSSNGSAEGVEEIPRNVNAGHLVTKVRAYDADIGYNGWLLFSLQEVTDHSLFGLDRYTGQIRTLRSFTETDEAEHKLVILVKDNGNVSLSATATVIVKLVEPKEAFAASDVKSSAKADDDNNVTFYLMITLGSVSALFLISIIVLIAMQCSKSTDYTSKYLQETNYDGTLCHSIQYRSGDKRYMLVGPRMSIGSTIVPGSHANTLVLPDRRRTSEEVRLFL